MPIISFWVKDKVYFKFVSLTKEAQKELKKSWRKEIEQALKES
jgi:hypothetical protein